MSVKVVELPTPAPTPKKPPTPPWKAFGAIIIVMFVLGLALGSCSLGMKLPVALYDLVVSKL